MYYRRQSAAYPICFIISPRWMDLFLALWIHLLEYSIFRLLFPLGQVVTAIMNIYWSSGFRLEKPEIGKLLHFMLSYAHHHHQTAYLYRGSSIKNTSGPRKTVRLKTIKLKSNCSVMCFVNSLSFWILTYNFSTSSNRYYGLLSSRCISSSAASKFHSSSGKLL
jgi:hypothetical protein